MARPIAREGSARPSPERAHRLPVDAHRVGGRGARLAAQRREQGGLSVAGDAGDTEDRDAGAAHLQQRGANRGRSAHVEPPGRLRHQHDRGCLRKLPAHDELLQVAAREGTCIRPHSAAAYVMGVDAPPGERRDGAWPQQAVAHQLVGKVAMDDAEQCPDYYRDASPAAGIEGTRDLIAYVRAMPGNEGALVRPVITPRFIPSCTDPLLEGLGVLAEETAARRRRRRRRAARDATRPPSDCANSRRPAMRSPRCATGLSSHHARRRMAGARMTDRHRAVTHVVVAPPSRICR